MSAVRVFLAVALAMAPFACSFSKSSKSLSNSISSPFKWSSKSSKSSSPEESAYREDVRDYTTAYVRSGGELEAFQRGVGELARQRGIANWEADAATCTSIGEGLRKAELGEEEVRAFATRLFDSDPEPVRYVALGYASGR